MLRIFENTCDKNAISFTYNGKFVESSYRKHVRAGRNRNLMLNQLCLALACVADSALAINDLMKHFNSNGLIHDIIVVSMKKVCTVTNQVLS